MFGSGFGGEGDCSTPEKNFASCWGKGGTSRCHWTDVPEAQRPRLCALIAAERKLPGRGIPIPSQNSVGKALGLEGTKWTEQGASQGQPA